jgi:hypothetical protein
MAERFNPADIDQTLLSFKKDGRFSWEEAVYKSGVDLLARYGNDSTVFGLGEDVYKVYRKGIKFLPKLLLYEEITNKASEMEWNLDIGGTNYVVNVNPISDVYVRTDTNFLCARSKLIQGHKMVGMKEDSDTLIKAMRNLEGMMNTDLGTEGIKFTMQLLMTTDENHLVVIDLCERIGHLRKI